MTYEFLSVEQRPLQDMTGLATSDYVLAVGLNRPRSANALSGSFFTELTELLRKHKNDATHCRAIVIYGVGKHFSAGADLEWMKKAAELGPKENQVESQKIVDLFEAMVALPMPTICAVKGAAYGGAVGLAAAADMSFASLEAKFCLSEVKVGLIPAVIFPYLARKMRLGDLNRFALSGMIFSATEAWNAGLVQGTCVDAELEGLVIKELNHLLIASPEAQQSLKALSRHVRSESNQQSEATVAAIVKARASVSGKEGINAFFSQSKPSWQRKWPEGDKLFISETGR